MSDPPERRVVPRVQDSQRKPWSRVNSWRSVLIKVCAVVKNLDGGYLKKEVISSLGMHFVIFLKFQMCS